MTVNNLQHRFEQLIDSLAIKEGKRTYLKNQTNYLKKKLRQASLDAFDTPSERLYQISNQLKVLGFWYGGSFDRGVYIDKGFDIDIYISYVPKTKKIPLNPKKFTGEELFIILYFDLLHIHTKINPDLIIREKGPYTHAIPIRLDYEEKSVYFDCIPAFELPNNYLLVPDGSDGTKKVNPNLEEQGLSKVNKKQDGNATKLIWLIKYWNHHWDYPLKSYIIQRLVEEIFTSQKIGTWEQAITLFFREAVRIFNAYRSHQIVLRDRVHSDHSILNDYHPNQIVSFQEALNRASLFAQQRNWYHLFGTF